MTLVLMTLALLTTAGDPPADAKPKKEKLVCRGGENTGTRVRSPSVCKTAAAWQAEDDARNRALQIDRAGAR